MKKPVHKPYPPPEPEVPCGKCRHLRFTEKGFAICGHHAAPDPMNCAAFDDVSKHHDRPRVLAVRNGGHTWNGTKPAK